ncbi:matrixin family metalloprotease [Candidatus Pacearchaeota archaeon]|nr:matrixin family metalloprotease [Candidatus Pacearchaeota archaeon]
MGLKIFFGFVSILLVASLLSFYWLAPFNKIEFETKSANYNFSLGNAFVNMQFYPNMRFPKSDISYKIYNCPLQKKGDMLLAFEMIENRTILDFYPVEDNEEISVTCDSKTKIKDGMFIAGEGGPTNITVAGDFNVITRGSVLLIRTSPCLTPNVAIHELLHALGFDHSENTENIMYYISECGQSIGEDQVNLINDLYELPSYPDLVFENVSASISGRYLNVNLTIRNAGFKKSEKTEIIIYADDELTKSFYLESLGIGNGKAIILTNIWVPRITVENLEFYINSDFNELKKKNNRIRLDIKD